LRKGTGGQRRKTKTMNLTRKRGIKRKKEGQGMEEKCFTGLNQKHYWEEQVETDEKKSTRGERK